MKWYELLPNGESTTPLTPQVAMRQINASRGRDAQDFLLLWVHDGRPVAAASVFPFDRSVPRTVFVVALPNWWLATTTARCGLPESAGVKFQDVPVARHQPRPPRYASRNEKPCRTVYGDADRLERR